MADYVFGANILENLTTGMYQDSKVVFREYIQNSSDQIDKAIRENLLTPNEAVIDIWLDHSKRSITIKDNATGIPSADFQRILGNIADSDKTIGEDKGFRGIGRLCGLAYCNELVFTSSFKGEEVVSYMICDAAKMRTLIDENARGEKHTANDVLHAINRFEQRSVFELGLDRRAYRKLCKPLLSDKINNGGFSYGKERKKSHEAADRGTRDQGCRRRTGAGEGIDRRDDPGMHGCGTGRRSRIQQVRLPEQGD